VLERGQPIIISRELGRVKDRGRLKLLVSGQGACVRPEARSGTGCRVEGCVGDGTVSEGVAGAMYGWVCQGCRVKCGALGGDARDHLRRARCKGGLLGGEAESATKMRPAGGAGARGM